MYMLYLLLALFIPEPVAVVEESCLYAEINTCENGDRYLVQIIFWEKGKERFKEKDGTIRYHTGRVVKGFKVVSNERGERNKKVQYLPYRAGKYWYCSWVQDKKLYRIKFERLIFTHTDYDVEVWHSENRLHRDHRSGFDGNRY